jgi:hypothetical protein
MTSKKTPMNGPICRRFPTPPAMPTTNDDDDDQMENNESTRQAYGRYAFPGGAVAGRLSLGHKQKHQQKQS